MKRVISIVLLLISCIFKAQDPAFNNINQSLIYLNPSFTGSNGFIRNQSTYRNQWPNINGNYVTYNSCIDGYIKPLKAGIALSYSEDNQSRGTLRVINIAFSYAQYITLSKERLITLIPSIQASYDLSTLDKGRLNYGDFIDSRYGIQWVTNPPPATWSATPVNVPVSSIKYSNISAGALVNFWNGAYAGVSFANLLEPNISHLGTYHLPVRTTIHASGNFVTAPRNTAHLSAILRFQNEYYNFRFNIIPAFRDKFQIGLGYERHNTFKIYSGQTNSNYNGIIGYLGIKGKYFSINYSYDRAINKMLWKTEGSHELSFSISLVRKNDKDARGGIEQN